ncbi:MAG: DUF2958 domain-containing protein [Brevundimonas sp.]
MKLILPSMRARLIKAWRTSGPPLVKLFVPWNAGTWLISEIDPDDPDLAFALCDLGVGSPELGYLHIPEIEAVRGPFGLKIERDLHWSPEKGKTMEQYADEARARGRISA